MQHPAETAVLVFEDVEFDVVDRHNVPWLRGPQIAGALGYNRSDRIADLHARNAEEFTDELTQVVELDTAGGRQAVRIFSPRGCYLLGMLARTERAKVFRRWVLDVIEGRLVPRKLAALSVSQQLAALRYRMVLVRELATVSSAPSARELYANLLHVSRLLAMPVQSITDLAPVAKQASLPGVAA